MIIWGTQRSIEVHGCRYCERHGDYNNNNWIQHTISQNKDEYDDNTPKDQNINDTKGKLISDHLAAQ